jgi:hypothetical protein
MLQTGDGSQRPVAVSTNHARALPWRSAHRPSGRKLYGFAPNKPVTESQVTISGVGSDGSYRTSQAALGHAPRV